MRSQKGRYYADPLAPKSLVKVHDEWISDGTYAEMVQKSVIASTDVVLTRSWDSNAIYLAKRTVFPMKGIWCVGGRIFFNDPTFEDSISRCVRIETGVVIEPSRFQSIGGPNLYSWLKTAQGEFVGKNLAITFKLEASAEELKEMAAGLNPKEYDIKFGLQRFTRGRLEKEKVHPAMIDFFDDIFEKKYPEVKT